MAHIILNVLELKFFQRKLRLQNNNMSNIYHVIRKMFWPHCYIKKVRFSWRLNAHVLIYYIGILRLLIVG